MTAWRYCLPVEGFEAGSRRTLLPFLAFGLLSVRHGRWLHGHAAADASPIFLLDHDVDAFFDDEHCAFCARNAGSDTALVKHALTLWSQCGRRLVALRPDASNSIT